MPIAEANLNETTSLFSIPSSLTRDANILPEQEQNSQRSRYITIIFKAHTHTHTHL